MVNLRKIGAVATGALFVGATIGMTAAVTVPEAFSSSMLASAGVPKAKLIIGNGAGGIEADRISAQIIQSKVASALAVTGVAGQIAFTYGKDDLNDDQTGEAADSANFNAPVGCSGFNETADNVAGKSKVDTTGLSGCLLTMNQSLWFDGNADGDVSDSDDYVLYNGIYVVDGDAGDFAPALVKDVPVAGDLLKVKGTDYLVTKTENNNQTVEIGPAIKKNLVPVTSIDAANAVVITGTKKMQVVKAAGSKTLYVMDGTDVQYGLDVSSVDAADYDDVTTDITDNSDVFDGYKIFISNTSTGDGLSVRLAESAQLQKISDGQEGVLGYAKFHASDSDFAGGAGANRLIWRANIISVPKDDSVSLTDTYYTLKFSIDKRLTIVRDKTVSVASGTKMKDSVSDYAPIVDDNTGDFVVTVTGGVAKTPNLAIVEDTAVTDADKTGYNQVLVGGPVANSLTAELVTAGKSKVDWYTSEGDIEVVSNAFVTGRTAIIVAGKNREATKAAASALAAAL